MKKVKHFMDCWDYSNDEIMEMAELIMMLKKDAKAGHLENMPEGKKLKDITLTFIGSSGVRETSANDLAKLLPRFGATVILASPEGYELGGENDKNPEWMIQKNLDARKQACEEGGGQVILTRDPKEAVMNADYVYTGCFCYEGTESKSDFEIYERDFISKGYQVTQELLSINPKAKTMHYLPALRGKEMTDYAMDFEGSLLWRQAENRLHTQRGLMAYLMGPLSPDFEQAPFTEEEARAKEKIKKMRDTYGVEYTHK